MNELTYEEQLLIKASRESGLKPIAIMIGVANSFKNENQRGEWDDLIEVFSAYIDELLNMEKEISLWEDEGESEE